MAKQLKNISTKDIKPEEHLFHNVRINVYPRTLHINEINFWPGNARNLLDFDVLATKLQKNLSKIKEEEVIRYLAKQPRLKLAELKKSIKLNGVRVPLIVLDDHTLLDGNRRFFSCKLLQYEAQKNNKNLPDVLEEIPVYVIKHKAITDEERNKILAEANFVDDYKVGWSLDVRAKVINEFYEQLLSDGFKEDYIYHQIIDIYSVKPSQAREYINSCKLVKEFIDASKNKQEELDRRRIVEERFVYFWEFYNKSHKGRGALSEDELPDAKWMFFSMMRNERFKNLKQIEPMIRAKRDSHLWGLLTESKGVKIEQVDAIIKENKAGIAIQDKFRNFFLWLDKQDPEKLKQKNLTKPTIALIKVITEMLNRTIKP